MFLQGIRARLTVTFLIVILLTLAPLGGYILWYFYNHNLDSLSASMLTETIITEELMARELTEKQGKTDIDTIVKELGTRVDLRITVIDPTGKVIADSHENPSLMENHMDRPEVQSALSGQSGRAIRYSNTLRENLLYVAVPMQLHGEFLGVMRLSTTLAHVDNGFRVIQSAILASFFVACLIAITLSIRLAHKYTLPLETITAAAHEYAAGRLSGRIHIHSNDEIGVLAHTLNHLATSLEDKISEITSEKKKLELILQHMGNAVILLDRHGRLSDANKIALSLFNITPAMFGQHNIQVIGSSVLDRAVREATVSLAEKTIDVKTHIQGSRRVFQVFLAPLSSSDPALINGVLCVFHDITTLQELHERQSEFIANASHELATPLTAIQGFAETLRDGALEDREMAEKFLTIIQSEAERMSRLLQDLLKLAKMDAGEYRKQIAMESVPIEPLLREIIQETSPLWERKEQQIIDFDIACPVALLSNRDWLKQIFLNLLDNAIKYTPPKGQIYLSCHTEDDQFTIQIRDTGIGIPPADLSLIFNRFYRVDKARTRSAGGAGLGLSIVKFLVETLGGTISVTSEVDAGTTFTLRFPLSA